MKRATFSVMTLMILAVVTGCASHRHLPASCVGGDCTTAVAPESGCGTNASAACNAPCDDGAVPAKKHCPLLSRLCSKKNAKEPREQAAPAEAGPPTGAATYPYYTVRGPRDFLAKNPGSIGP
jgi:hypothetical protein